ncbi:calcium-binding protein [Niveispirillum fermenti]|uniref:calcium-binding protein n=1 Tax=Niveispirillum fermenti TaxID=1233113 RepID=UPI003A88D044
MTTLPGGQTVAFVGLNEIELSVLNTIYSNAGPSLASTIAQVTASPTSLTGAVTVGTITTTQVINQAVSGGANIVTLVDGGSPAPGSTGVLTNIVADSSVTNVILTNTGNNNVTAFFGGQNTTSVVGDFGSQFIVGSSNGSGMTILTGTGNDSVLGGAGNDVVRSGGDSIVNGGAGNDTIIGGSGMSTLGGGAGADSIVAGSGGSYIIGESGNDTLVGGAGKDIFIYSPGDGNDTIIGFDPTQDTLAFTSTNFGSGSLDLGALISNAQVSGGNTVLTLPDGSTITVVGLTGVSINWFTAK